MREKVSPELCRAGGENAGDRAAGRGEGARETCAGNVRRGGQYVSSLMENGLNDLIFCSRAAGSTQRYFQRLKAKSCGR